MKKGYLRCISHSLAYTTKALNVTNMWLWKKICEHHFLVKWIINQLIMVGSERWLGFPDLWPGQKPWWNWYLTPAVNFGEVRRAQLAKSTLFISTLVPLRSFKVCSDAKERVRCGKKREATAPIQSLVKLQPWFLSLRWKTCLWIELQPRFLRLQWRTCPWAEHWWWQIYHRLVFLTQTRRRPWIPYGHVYELPKDNFHCLLF